MIWKRATNYSTRVRFSLLVPRFDPRYMKDSVAYGGLVLWKAVTYNDSALGNDIQYRNLRLKLKSLDRQHPHLLVVLEKLILYVLDVLLTTSHL